MEHFTFVSESDSDNPPTLPDSQQAADHTSLELTEGPFTFPDDDEEVAKTQKHRRARRSGRGRKRPVSEEPDTFHDNSESLNPEEKTGQEIEEATSAKETENFDSPVIQQEETECQVNHIDQTQHIDQCQQADQAGQQNFLANDEENSSENNVEDVEVPVALRKKGRAKEQTEREIGKKLVSRGVMKMLISVLPGDEVEVVLTEDGQVREYYVEMMHQAKIRGNIYKAVISNVDSNLQAAFVNYGATKNGFLQIDEVHPDYYLQPYEPTKGHKFPPIQNALKPGQEVLVQVVREPGGSKGAFLTTWLSLAGRFLVLTPGQEEIGISRKVEDGEERNRLREMMKGINPGQDFGVIVRTVSAGTSKTVLQKDLGYLKRVWREIRKRAAVQKAPALIHQEPGLASRALRDYLIDDVVEIWTDDKTTAESLQEMVSLLFPRKPDMVHLYEGRESLWEHFGIVSQLEQVHSREIFTPSGGRLVFDQTEALMAIDVNSAKISGRNFETLAYRTNIEAAKTIAEQLRLRDIGGQIVIDFIEMRDGDHGREIEKTLHEAMRCDRARHDIGKMSSFGLLQLVRQRIGSSAISMTLEPCPYCQGTGQRRNLEWRAIQTLRDLQVKACAAASAGQNLCVCSLESDLAMYLLNSKRDRLHEIEQHFGLRVEIRVSGFENNCACQQIEQGNRFVRQGRTKTVSGRVKPISQIGSEKNGEKKKKRSVANENVSRETFSEENALNFPEESADHAQHSKSKDPEPKTQRRTKKTRRQTPPEEEHL